MLLIITGTRCAGKSTIEDYLSLQKGFQVLQFVEGSSSSDDATVAGDPSKMTAPSTPTDTEQDEWTLSKSDSLASTATTASTTSQPAVQALQMHSMAYMLDYVTRNWQTDFVTMKLDGTRPEVLAEFARRPFCAILHVDAPIMVRWERARSVKCL